MMFSVLLSQFESVAGQDVVEELVFAQVPFNHPLFIMYSSGTTGAPKSMVHSVGVKHACYMFLTT